MKYSIIIPTLNEAGNIAPLLARLQPLAQRPDSVLEIIFVDDGSSDGTPEVISAYTGFLNIRLVCRENQRGLDGAVVACAKAAASEIPVVMDCDLSHPPQSAAGRDVLVLARSRSQLEASGFGGNYRPLGEIGEITVSKRGKKAGRYYYRLLTWYSLQPASEPTVAPVRPRPEYSLGRHAVQTETTIKTPGKHIVL